MRGPARSSSSCMHKTRPDCMLQAGGRGHVPGASPGQTVGCLDSTFETRGLICPCSCPCGRPCGLNRSVMFYLAPGSLSRMLKVISVFLAISTICPGPDTISVVRSSSPPISPSQSPLVWGRPPPTNPPRSQLPCCPDWHPPRFLPLLLHFAPEHSPHCVPAL